MNLIMKQLISSIVIVCFVFTLTISRESNAKDWLVKSIDEYEKAHESLKPGDSITLKNGVWKDFEILFKAIGLPEKPIVLKAETKGQVILSGNSNLRLAGEHLLVSGLIFKDGFSPSNAVISFRRNKNDLANNSRVTEIVIEEYSNPDRHESDYWVALYGKNNRFDHNYLVGKRNKGVTLAVRLNSESSQENHHRIDHNYFGPRPIFGANGGETLRIGTSHYSLTNSHTVVENNFFDRCNGEVEIISVKSGKNILRNNTFFESRGTLTLRHGNNNLIEGNVFIGNQVDHTGGIRVINRNQVIRNNYLEGLTGYRFGSGFTVMNGVPDSPINRYHQVDNAKIYNNSLINVKNIHLAAGSDKERSAVPINSEFSNNLIINDSGESPFAVFDDVSGIVFSNNISNREVLSTLTRGFEIKNIDLKRSSNGLMYPQDKKYKDLGAPETLKPTNKADTGPSWYTKNEIEFQFDTGKLTRVRASGDALFKAVENADSGDILELDEGEYELRKIVKINKTLSIRAKTKHAASLKFSRSALFEIADGGSLKIDGLKISGESAPDTSGNSLFRTAKWGMLKNYRFVMTNNIVEKLNINHSFHLFDAGARSFAKLVHVENNEISNVTGDIFRLNKEIDDLGIYNVEYLRLKNNQFSHVQGALAKVYRGGTDESTFGPHFELTNNRINELGKGKRNKSKASIALHGVQVSDISHNQFNNALAIDIEHTVGEPKTKISNNKFIDTPGPIVEELNVTGAHTAIIKNNITE